MEKTYQEDGFNVVVIECDGCGEKISQVREAEPGWFEVRIEPLARDHWNAGETVGEFHFCSTECFHSSLDGIDPSGTLKKRR